MVVAQHAAEAGERVVLELVGLLVLAQGSQSETEQPRVFRTGFLLVLCYFLAVQPSVVNFLRCAVSES